MTCVLTVVSLMKSSWPISAFERPRGDQAEDLPLALGQILELARRRGVRDARELLDHAPGDRRREERVAGGDGADRREQLLGRVVLEHEPARAGAQRLVDVLVEVERRQDQDPRAESSAARMRRVASSPSSSGMRMSIRTTVGREARGLVDRLEPVRSPRRPPRCRPRRESSMRKPARTIDWSSATRTRMLTAGPRAGAAR